uniref:Uncharacterized protein LOC114341706 n=1 Tax=Diabrotica virgifera virgifera TaxID=50390 RepID=A0A6P7GSP1_DIAVI
MHCKFSVEAVKRMNRKVVKQDGTKEYVPTKTFFVTFKASRLPQYICINHVRIPVEPYEQKVLLCFNCYRYGHLIKQCKSNVRCLKCKDGHETKDCRKNLVEKTCFYCSGEHYTNQIKECPEFDRQKSIKKLMTEQNLSYAEANTKTPKVTYAQVVVKNPGPTEILNNKYIADSNHNLNNNSHDLQLQSNIFPSSQMQPSGQKSSSVHSQHSAVSHKRPRLARSQEQDNTLNLHKKMISPIHLPSSSTAVFENQNYKSNLTLNQSHQETCVTVTENALVGLILSIIGILKQQNKFEIQESTLLSIIQDKFNAISDDELF